MSTKNTIYLVTGDADLRKTLSTSFKAAKLNLVALTRTDEYLNDEDDELKPHGCLIVDADGDGLDIEADLAEQGVEVPVIVLVRRGDVAGAVRALKSGAFDVVEKPVRGTALTEPVRKALALFGRLENLLDQHEIARERVASLTRREMEVLDQIVQGKPNREIAAELGISPKTLDIHRSNIMAKIEARTVADLARVHLLNRTPLTRLHLLAG